MRTKLHNLTYIILLFCSCEHHKNLVVIQNVNFFDGEDYQTNINIVIDSNVIADITTENNWPDNSLVINGHGKTVIPPLLNAHVHVWKEDNLKEALASGVFALLDMHTTDKGANVLRKYNDSIDYAFYYSSGPGATVPFGHGTQYGITVPTINSSVTPKEFVEDRVKGNADYIKILREPLRATISFTQTQQVIDVAHQNSKLCVAHVSILSDAMTLNSQNIDGFVHIWFDEKINEAQMDSLAKSKVFIVPTLSVTKKVLELNHTKKWDRTLLTFDEVLEETKKIYASGVPILAGTDAPNLNFNYGNDFYM